ncbi:MAG: hypothetical protein LBR22_11335 [Desulfovibrio sp.]|jgi:hypothetical protein|nr:hypothetical protein [Desulfovibrio sp.]
MARKKSRKKKTPSTRRRQERRRDLARQSGSRLFATPVEPWVYLHATADSPELKRRHESGNGTVAHALAQMLLLPPGFDGWGWKTPNGSTVAHFAASSGTVLPADFEGWRWRDGQGISVAANAALAGTLPKDFDTWDIIEYDGDTVAHHAARRGPLPEGFDRWELRGDYGKTPAHEAAEAGRLPAGFDRWELADERGWTVAHACALAACQTDMLPGNAMAFEDSCGVTPGMILAATSKKTWRSPSGDLRLMVREAFDEDDYTMKRILYGYGKRIDEIVGGRLKRLAQIETAPMTGRLDRMNADDPVFRQPVDDRGSMTHAHLAAWTCGLPEGFADWTLKDVQGSTVAHFAAMRGWLPEDFGGWHLLDDDGTTVAETWLYLRPLPEGFRAWWDVKPPCGVPLPLQAAMLGRLPEGFDDWDVKVEKGLKKSDPPAPLAFHCARHGCLPKWFDRWDIALEDGWTVAHEAARHGTLPERVGDEVLEMTGGKDGHSVARVALAADEDAMPPPFGENALRLRKRIFAMRPKARN